MNLVKPTRISAGYIPHGARKKRLPKRLRWEAAGLQARQGVEGRG